ncbi:MAG: 3-deoxy-manno-octulosonate cytidylyltransferase [Nitrospirota bacterium]|nr:3-deoxy-manno-octulosonate cytidylyltransferase [Nitrospirota bacterium]MDH5768313.1 3-deoxy-manno-octulosonate cytidylyltransferase [Nitrospirota bacterium]
MTSIVIIPARYHSTRFPGKPLCPLLGKPLIQYVYENSKRAHLIDDVFVATDNETIFESVTSFGGKAIITSIAHASGTDRVAEVAALMDYDIIVNVQGDEPLIQPQMIDEVISLLDDKRASIGTLIKKVEDPEEISDPNVVKVVFDKEGFALYFSRAPIPFCRDEWKIQSKEQRAKSKDVKSKFEIRDSKFEIRNCSCYKHIGIYSYRKEALIALSRMEPTELERIEKLEQLRALEHGMRIKTKETFFETYGVDTPEDLERVKKCLSTSL